MTSSAWFTRANTLARSPEDLCILNKAADSLSQRGLRLTPYVLDNLKRHYQSGLSAWDLIEVCEEHGVLDDQGIALAA